MSSSPTSRSSTWSEMEAATSSRTGGPNRRRASSRSSACSRSSSRSSSTSSSALRVTRNRWCSTTCMPEKSCPRWAAISSSTGRNRACAGRAARRSAAVDRHEPRHVVGHLDPGEQLRPAVRDRAPPRPGSATGPRCTGTGAPGRPPAASAPGRSAPGSRRAAARARRRPARPSAGSGCPASASAGLDVVGEAGRVPGHQLGGALGDRAPAARAGISPSAPRDRQAGLQAPLQAGDAHHVELVQVAGEDREELGPLQQRACRGPRRG